MNFERLTSIANDIFPFSVEFCSTRAEIRYAYFNTIFVKKRGKKFHRAYVRHASVIRNYFFITQSVDALCMRHYYIFIRNDHARSIVIYIFIDFHMLKSTVTRYSSAVDFTNKVMHNFCS